MSGAEAAALVAIGTVAFLDRWPVLQAMLSRPIVVGTAVGVALGDPAAGALWGAVFEAMYLGLLPVGAARLPDPGLAALTGTTVALLGQADGTFPAIVAGGLGWIAGHAGEAADGLQRRWNGVLAARGREGADEGDPAAPGRAIAIATASAALLGAALSAVAVAGASAAATLGPGPWTGALEAGPLRILVAGALAVAGARAFVGRDRSLAAFGAGAAVAAVVVWSAA